MAILGTPLDRQKLLDLMERVSTGISWLMGDIDTVGKQMLEISDEDLETIFGGSDPTGDRAAFRTWLAAIVGLNDNYEGNGTVADRAFEIAKRARPRI